MKRWIVVLLIVGCGTPKKQASVYLTTPDEQQLLKEQPPLNVVKDTLPINIHIDTAKQFQEIEGFGAAMTGSSAYVMQQYMNAAQRDSLLRDLFNADKGIGVNYIRMSIGASDFSVAPYSYDDMPAGKRDDSLTHFSVDKDCTLLRVMKEVVKINPDLHIMATPWSPPGWMKTSDKLEGGSLRIDAYDVYAHYFIQYLKAFAKHGINVTSLSVQNEPQYEAYYPSMKMTAPEQGAFIKNNLGPLLEKEGLHTQILLFDHNWNSPEYPISILDDTAIARYATGAAFHCYEGSVDAMGQVHAAHPEKGLYFTECSGGNWAPSFADNLQYMVGNLLIGTVNNWSKNVLLWNMALDEHNGPTTNQPDTSKRNKGCMTCRGVVTVASANGAVTKNVEYYSLGHFSKFVRPGAKRVYSSFTEGLAHTAFLNKDGSRVLVVLNTGKEDTRFSVQDGVDIYPYMLKAGAVTTIILHTATNSSAAAII
jgi:glucosylceramidase